MTIVLMYHHFKNQVVLSIACIMNKECTADIMYRQQKKKTPRREG